MQPQDVYKAVMEVTQAMYHWNARRFVSTPNSIPKLLTFRAGGVPVVVYCGAAKCVRFNYQDGKVVYEGKLFESPISSHIELSYGTEVVYRQGDPAGRQQPGRSGRR